MENLGKPMGKQRILMGKQGKPMENNEKIAKWRKTAKIKENRKTKKIKETKITKKP